MPYLLWLSLIAREGGREACMLAACLFFKLGTKVKFRKTELQSSRGGTFETFQVLFSVYSTSFAEIILAIKDNEINDSLCLGEQKLKKKLFENSTSQAMAVYYHYSPLRKVVRWKEVLRPWF